MKEKLDASIVAVLVNVIYTASVERRGTADDSMNLGLIQNTVRGKFGHVAKIAKGTHLVAFLEKELGQI